MISEPSPNQARRGASSSAVILPSCNNLHPLAQQVLVTELGFQLVEQFHSFRRSATGKPAFQQEGGNAGFCANCPRAYSVTSHAGSGKSSCSSWARWPTSRDSLRRCSKRMAVMATGGRPPDRWSWPWGTWRPADGFVGLCRGPAPGSSLVETVPRVCCPLAGPARLESW